MKKDLLKDMREGANLSRTEQIELVLKLSLPAIFAQISTIIMQYIDASMVGSLGSAASASIGIVSTTTWLIGGLAGAVGVGFTVGIAHAIGAGDDKGARRYVKTGFLTVICFALILMLIGILIHKELPVWMGGDESVLENAANYFLVYSFTLPLMQINHVGSGMLECSGNMKLPSVLNVISCFLDVVFNMFFIYPTRTVNILGDAITIPGFDLGVLGAALGTLCAVACGSIAILLSVLAFSDKLHLRRGERGLLSFGKWIETIKVSLPVMASSLIMGSAYVVSTRIVSPLGNVAISANSFAITAESLCYMPGYGIAHAATTLVGQAKGAGRFDQEKSLARLSIAAGMLIMVCTGVLLYIFAPQMIGIMTPDKEIRELGTAILRIEAFAEPMFGASIVCEGVFRGLGRTIIPSALNLISMWFVRLPLSALAAHYMGLKGVWIVMCGELIFRGLIFIIAERREFRNKA
ncbi:MAG: MATE family efflux transporter [Lachnospiraceae bacterium]|nr:MATE family efflux transporter [Lachnospiraceae bacterium]